VHSFKRDSDETFKETDSEDIEKIKKQKDDRIARLRQAHFVKVSGSHGRHSNQPLSENTERNSAKLVWTVIQERQITKEIAQEYLKELITRKAATNASKLEGSTATDVREGKSQVRITHVYSGDDYEGPPLFRLDRWELSNNDFEDSDLLGEHGISNDDFLAYVEEREKSKESIASSSPPERCIRWPESKNTEERVGSRRHIKRMNFSGTRSIKLSSHSGDAEDIDKSMTGQVGDTAPSVPEGHVIPPTPDNVGQAMAEIYEDGQDETSHHDSFEYSTSGIETFMERAEINYAESFTNKVTDEILQSAWNEQLDIPEKEEPSGADHENVREKLKNQVRKLDESGQAEWISKERATHLLNKAALEQDFDKLTWREGTMLMRRLLSNGRTVEAIHKEWLVGTRFKHFPALMWRLLFQKRYHILFRCFEAGLHCLRNSFEFMTTFKTGRVGIIILLHLIAMLNRSKLNPNNAFVNIRTWEDRINQVSHTISMYSLDQGLEGKSIIRLISGTTSTECLMLYSAFFQYKLRCSEDVRVRFMRTMTKYGMFSDAFKILKELESLPRKNLKGLKESKRLIAYRELMYSLSKAGVPIHSSELLDVLLSYRHKLDPRLYHLFFYSAVKASDLETATVLLKDLEPITDTRPSPHTYVAMFNLYKKFRDKDGMKAMFLRARQIEFDPRSQVILANSVLHAMSTLDKGSEFLNISTKYQEFYALTLVSQIGLPRAPPPEVRHYEYNEPDAYTLTIMLHAFFREKAQQADRQQLAWVLYEQYLRNLRNPNAHPVYSQPNEHVFAIFIYTLGMSQHTLDKAVAVLQYMTSNPEVPGPTLITFNSLLLAFARHSDMESTKKLWAVIQKQRFTTDAHSYNAMILCHVNVKDYTGAGKWLARMTKYGWDGRHILRWPMEENNKEDLMAGYQLELENMEEAEGKPVVPLYPIVDEEGLERRAENQDDFSDSAW